MVNRRKYGFCSGKLWVAAAIMLSFLLLLSTTPALPQNQDDHPDLLDLSLEELMSIEIDSVYGASGFKQKVTEAPASVTIITSEQIQRYGWRNRGVRGAGRDHQLDGRRRQSPFRSQPAGG